MAFVKIIGKVCTPPKLKTLVNKKNQAYDVLEFSIIFGTYTKDGKVFEPRVPCSMFNEPVFYSHEFIMGDVIEVVGRPENEMNTGREGMGWQPMIKCLSIRRIGNPLDLGTTDTMVDSYFDVSGPIKYMKETAKGTFVTLLGAQKPNKEAWEWHKLVWWHRDGIFPPEGMAEGKWLQATGLYNITSYDSTDKNGDPIKRVEAQCLVKQSWFIGQKRFDYTNTTAYDPEPEKRMDDPQPEAFEDDDIPF